METLFGSELDSGRSPHRKSWRFWLLVISPFLFLGMCGVLYVKTKNVLPQAEREVDAFHERLETAQYDAIWAASSPAFQGSVERSALGDYLRTIHEKMGSCQDRAKVTGEFANANMSATTVRLQYRVNCSNGPLDETFTFTVNGAAVELLSYGATSPFLLTK